MKERAREREGKRGRDRAERERGEGGERYSCLYRLDMITLDLSNIHTTFHKRSLCVFFQFSSALAQGADSEWEKGCANGSSSVAPGLPAPTRRRDVTHRIPWGGDTLQVGCWCWG